MPRRRASRFAFEVLFLVAVAAALTIAELRPVVVAGVMLLGWLVVALFEWAAWLDEPHFGSGLPPRYYVPQVALPPARPVEQLGSGYPDSQEREEELTWIDSPSAWGEVIEDWPILDSSAAGEETEIAAPDQIEEQPVGELPPAPQAEPAVPEAELTSELDPSILEDSVAAPEEGVLEQELEVQRDVEAVPELDAPVVPDGLAPLVQEPEPEREAEPEAEPGSRRRPAAPEVGRRGRPGPARHRIDPLALPQGGLFRRRRGQGDGAVVEVQDRPPAVRALPGRARRED